MSRLWSRFGLRTLSIMVLLLGLVGGAYLGLDRQNQQRVTNADVQASIDRAYAVQQQQVSAPQLAAAAAAQQTAADKAQSAANQAAVLAKKAEDAHRANQATSRSTNRTSPTPSFGPVPSSCKTYSGNRATGCALLLDAGFALSEMPCLDNIWTRESNWRTNALNASSGSYGIPQALPANKMAVYGSDYRTNPVPQIKWGLNYIKTRYGTPCDAWTFWQAHNWY